MRVFFYRGREWNTFVFLKLFGTPGISRQNWDIPPKNLVCLRFEGHTEFFGTTPSRGRPPPHPIQRYLDPKFWVWVPFSCLKIRQNLKSATAQITCTRKFRLAFESVIPTGLLASRSLQHTQIDPYRQIRQNYQSKIWNLQSATVKLPTSQKMPGR